MRGQDVVIIIRESTSTTVTIANGGNLSTAFDMSIRAMLGVHMPAAWTSASIGFKVAQAEDGTYLPLYDKDGGLVQIDSPTASKAYTAPSEVATYQFVKLWSQNGSGTNTNQAATRVIGVSLKA